LNTPTAESLCFFPAVFDDALPDDARFAEMFGRLKAHVARCLEVQLPLLVVFVCHPERLCYSGPLEQWQYGNGVNHGPAGVPAGIEKRRSRAEVDRALVNFRTVIRYLRDTPGLEPITTREMMKRYGRQASHLSRPDPRVGRTRGITDAATPSVARSAPRTPSLALLRRRSATTVVS
jgi:hypothetical protein